MHPILVPDNQRDQVVMAQAAIMDLYWHDEPHPWDAFINSGHLGRVQPFALGFDWPRLRHALTLVLMFGTRVANAFTFGYWI